MVNNDSYVVNNDSYVVNNSCSVLKVPLSKGRAVSFSVETDGEVGKWGDGENFSQITDIFAQFIDQ